MDGGSMAAGRLDPRVRRYVSPTRVVWTSGEGVSSPEALLTPDSSICRLTPTPDATENPAILLDFGRELHGSIRLEVPTTSTGRPARVRIRFGESASEAMGQPNQDHTIHDHEVLAAWMGHTEVGQTGFRFVRIDLLDTETALDLRAVEAVFLYRDLPYLGSFECSDARLNEIWQTGAYTVHLCMQDHVWDGIKRDRLVWIGDLHPEAMVIASVFGAHEIVPQSLDSVRDRTPLPGWMNGISSYSLWWILIQWDWFRYGGDLQYLREQRDYLIGLLARIEERIGPDGGELLDGHRFLEWPTSGDKAATDAGLQALTVLALRAGAHICEALGEAEAGAQASVAADRAAGVRRPTGSKQATALGVLAGKEDPAAANRDVFASDPFRGLSTFYGYYVLQARTLAGDVAGGLDLLRAYWGGMLDAGATTFWEGFELDWLEGSGRIDEITPAGLRDLHADFGDWCYKGLRHSLCHGWAAGPTAWLIESVLGLSPAVPGFTRVHVTPDLGGLEWARGTLPTPHGLIEIELERGANGETQVKRLVLPEGVQAEGMD